MSVTNRTFETSDLDGSNRRTITTAQYRAELDERAIYARAIMDAMVRKDLTACAAAQKVMRERFGK